jgi:hypothetical protein
MDDAARNCRTGLNCRKAELRRVACMPAPATRKKLDFLVISSKVLCNKGGNSDSAASPSLIHWFWIYLRAR